jgi:hypothetical protein
MFCEGQRMTTFSYDGSVIQYDTITAAGIYDISATGGQGGNSTQNAQDGGLAASSGGDIFLQAGAVLEIVVGGAGGNNSGHGAGGGGGSFVIEINTGSSAVDINEVIAGGGGGAGVEGTGGSGLAGTTGGSAGGFDSGGGGANGSAGSGGLDGGGGGGFEGGNGGGHNGTGSSGIAPGSDFAGGGGAGGGANGGFGGGGGGGISGGGGGGGYGGGGGGGPDISNGGGGGGSYVNPLATNVSQSAGVNSGNGLVTITPVVLCFLAGTLILTSRGEVPVEQLRIGDTVVTSSGRQRRLCWIGQGRALATRGRRGAATPVIVKKGALSDNVPHHDLHITKGHSLYLDGVLIPVECLVNHRSILWDDRAQEVTVYHLELDSHDVLLANGAPAESYRDDGNRWLFRNANAGWDQPPKPPYAPVLTGGTLVDAVWRRLLDRAGPRANVPITDDPDLHLMVDGRRLDPTARDGNALVFALPTRPDAVRVASRAAVPQELGLARDPRSLGVALRRVVVRQGTRFCVAKADDPRLAQGFHAFEANNNFVWTDGDAALPMALLAEFSGPLEIVLIVACTAHYIEDGIPEIAVGLHSAARTVPVMAAPPERAAA